MASDKLADALGKARRPDRTHVLPPHRGAATCDVADWLRTPAGVDAILDDPGMQTALAARQAAPMDRGALGLVFEQVREAGRQEGQQDLCRCDNVEVGSYDHFVQMHNPFIDDLATIDVCIATEIAELWHHGIQTMASCCGHSQHQATVSVHPDQDQLMPGLGYELADESEPKRWRLPASGEAKEVT